MIVEYNNYVGLCPLCKKSSSMWPTYDDYVKGHLPYDPIYWPLCQRASYDRIIMPNMANVFFYNDLTYTIGKDHLPYDRTNYVRGHFLYDLMCTHYVKGHLPFDLT